MCTCATSDAHGCNVALVGADGLKKIETDMNAQKDASSETRIRVNMHNTLTVKFMDLMTTYQEAQVRSALLGASRVRAVVTSASRSAPTKTRTPRRCVGSTRSVRRSACALGAAIDVCVCDVRIGGAVNPNMTDEEINNAIESGARNVFAQELTKEKYTKEAEEALNYVQHKHKQIKKLEQSIIELHQVRGFVATTTTGDDD